MAFADRGERMPIIMGPVLKFVGVETTGKNQKWRVSALVVTHGDEPELTYSDRPGGKGSAEA